jgi:hypothetical protein
MLALFGCWGDGTGPDAHDPVIYDKGGTTLVGLTAVDLAGDAHRHLVAVARDDGWIRALPGAGAGKVRDAWRRGSPDGPLQGDGAFWISGLFLFARMLFAGDWPTRGDPILQLGLRSG